MLTDSERWVLSDSDSKSSGTFQSSCGTYKLHAMCCDIFSNMLEFVLPINLLSDFQTVCSIVIIIP